MEPSNGTGQKLSSNIVKIIHQNNQGNQCYFCNHISKEFDGMNSTVFNYLKKIKKEWS